MRELLGAALFIGGMTLVIRIANAVLGPRRPWERARSQDVRHSINRRTS